MLSSHQDWGNCILDHKKDKQRKSKRGEYLLHQRLLIGHQSDIASDNFRIALQVQNPNSPWFDYTKEILSIRKKSEMCRIVSITFREDSIKKRSNPWKLTSDSFSLWILIWYFLNTPYSRLFSLSSSDFTGISFIWRKIWNN